MSVDSIIKKILDWFAPEIKANAEDSFKLSLLSNSKFIEVKKETNVTNNYYNIIIDLNKASPEQKEKLIEIYPEIKENNGLILQQNNYSDLADFLKEGKNASILKYFKGKISDQDFEALRIAVFIKKKFFVEGEDISVYLEQLYRKFGSRGRNINNLYSEGYFESFIKPYYALLESENRINEFAQGFDNFVTEQPITYFINQYKTQEQVNKELSEKIMRNKKYGIKRLNIHGIGEKNIVKAVEFIKIIETNLDVKIISRIQQDNKISLSFEII